MRYLVSALESFWWMHRSECCSRCGDARPKQAAGASSEEKLISWSAWNSARSPEAREEAGVDVELIRLLCVTDHVLPNEEQHWVAPAYLGRIVGGNARNCEPDKTREVRWFEIGSIPQNLTMTARNAIGDYLRKSHVVRS